MCGNISRNGSSSARDGSSPRAAAGLDGSSERAAARQLHHKQMVGRGVHVAAAQREDLAQPRVLRLGEQVAKLRDARVVARERRRGRITSVRAAGGPRRHHRGRGRGKLGSLGRQRPRRLRRAVLAHEQRPAGDVDARDERGRRVLRRLEVDNRAALDRRVAGSSWSETHATAPAALIASRTSRHVAEYGRFATKTLHTTLSCRRAALTAAAGSASPADSAGSGGSAGAGGDGPCAPPRPRVAARRRRLPPPPRGALARPSRCCCCSRLAAASARCASRSASRLRRSCALARALASRKTSAGAPAPASP